MTPQEQFVEERFDEVQAEIVRRMQLPQYQVVSFRLDAETLRLLRERAARGPSTLGEVIREMLRLGFWKLAEDEFVLEKLGVTGYTSEEPKSPETQVAEAAKTFVEIC